MQHSIWRVPVHTWTLKFTLRAHVQRVFPWSMRREAMKTLGALGVLDPFVHKNIQKNAFEKSMRERSKNPNKHADKSPTAKSPRDSPRSPRGPVVSPSSQSPVPSSALSPTPTVVSSSKRFLNTYVPGVKHFAMATVDEDMHKAGRNFLVCMSLICMQTCTLCLD